jgi:hypothetical protein
MLGAPSLRDQEAKQHADGANALSRRGPSRVLTLLQNKLPQVFRVIPAWIFAELLDYGAQFEAVNGKSGVRDTALLAHPVTEEH